jgi:hypothetical protein
VAILIHVKYVNKNIGLCRNGNKRKIHKVPNMQKKNVRYYDNDEKEENNNNNNKNIIIQSLTNKLG